MESLKARRERKRAEKEAQRQQAILRLQESRRSVYNGQATAPISAADIEQKSFNTEWQDVEYYGGSIVELNSLNRQIEDKKALLEDLTKQIDYESAQLELCQKKSAEERQFASEIANRFMSSLPTTEMQCWSYIKRINKQEQKVYDALYEKAERFLRYNSLDISDGYEFEEYVSIF
jgi:hypothetical protein